MSVVQIKDASSDNQLKVNSDGSINVNTSGGSSTPTTITGTVTADTAGLSAFQTSQYTITTTPTQLTATPLANRSSISMTVEASPNVAVYIGNSNSVSTSNGYPLYDGSTLQLDLTPSGQIWAVTATSGQIIAVLEIA